MKKTQIIAEIAQGYEGDIKLCERFVKLAKQCGADGVKFQIFEAEELCLPNYKYYDLFKSLYIEQEEWKKIIELCNELKIDFYADVFGTKTLEWMLKFKIGGVKIHSTDLKNYSFLKELKDKNTRIIVGVGGSTLMEIEKAIDYLGKNEVIVMSGFQAEPNLIEDIELNKIQIIKKQLGVKVGYTDHIEVTNLLTKSLSAMAVLMGADYIEKHLTIERDSLQLEDYISALNPDEFKEMVNDGKIFSVVFIKKDGSVRKMVARLGVHKHLKGGELKYDAASKKLLPVFDMEKEEYRMINVSTIQEIKVGGTKIDLAVQN